MNQGIRGNDAERQQKLREWLKSQEMGLQDVAGRLAGAGVYYTKARVGQVLKGPCSSEWWHRMRDLGIPTDLLPPVQDKHHSCSNGFSLP